MAQQHHSLIALADSSSCSVRRRRGARGLRLVVKSDGEVVLTMPHSYPLIVGQRFVARKQAWIVETRQQILKRPRPLLSQGDEKEYTLTKEAARRCILERVEYFQNIYGVSFRSLSIRNQKTRFGSCSARGHLSFNYRLIYLPEHLRDYVVVHELCHLIELNHSARFWALVARTMPDYRLKKQHLQAFSRTKA